MQATKSDIGKQIIVTMLLVSLPAWANAQPTSVSVDVSQLDENTFDRIDAIALENKVIVRLLQEGFAAVDTNEKPSIRVVYVSGTMLGIGVQAGDVMLWREVEIGNDLNLDALHLEVSQKTVELVRQIPSSKRTKPENPVPIPLVTHQLPKLSQPLALPQQPLAQPLALNVMTGIVYRGEADSLFGLELAYSLFGSNLALTGGIDLVFASTSNIDIFEWQTQLGLSWAVLINTWQLSLGISGGILIHHFSLSSDSGSRINALVTVPLSLTHKLKRGLALGIRLSPGFTPTSREHTASGQQLWQRSSARLEFLGYLSWQL